MPQVSVIVPAYNAEERIFDCLRAIQIQTFTDFEAIIVDDGSTDGTLDVLKKFTSTDKRFVVLEQKNGGASVARNNGLKAASGKYVTFVDADDFLTPDAIEHLHWHAEKHGCDVTIGRKLLVGSRTREFLPDLFKKPVKCEIPKNIPDLRYHIAPHAKFIRKEFLEKNNIKFLENYTYEDFLFSYEIYLKCKKIGVILNNCYYYFKNVEGSVTQKSETPFNVESRIFIEKAVWKICSDLDPQEEIFKNTKRTTFKTRLQRHIEKLNDSSSDDQSRSFDLIKNFVLSNKKFITKNMHGLQKMKYIVMMENDFQTYLRFGLEFHKNLHLDIKSGILSVDHAYSTEYGISDPNLREIGTVDMKR